MNDSKPTLIVLAAGMGSRYGGLKQIDPVGPNGATLLDYSICDAVRGGFGDVIFVIRRDIEKAFIDGVGAKYEGVDQLEVRYAYQELDDLPESFVVPEGRQKPWGTAHATLAARDLVSGPFAVINADDFYGRRAYELLAGHLSAGTEEHAMVGFVLRETLSAHGTVTRGVCRTEGEYLQTIDEVHEIEQRNEGAVYRGEDGEERALVGDETVSMNFWGFPPSILEPLERGLIEFLRRHIDEPKSEYLLPGVVDELIRSGDARVRVLPGGGPWFGVTYKDDREGVMRSIRSLIDEGEYPEHLWR